MQPEISVIMPVYNIEKYLPEAIESILNQTFENFELIILDDKSEDGTLSVAKKYADKDKRIRVIALEKRQKQGVGRNIGIEKDLLAPPSNRFEHLKGEYKGFCSIRINDQFRIMFKFENGKASKVRIIDYH